MPTHLASRPSANAAIFSSRCMRKKSTPAVKALIGDAVSKLRKFETGKFNELMDTMLSLDDGNFSTSDCKTQLNEMAIELATFIDVQKELEAMSSVRT